ncbi:MAG: hypothetical protein DRI57_08830 [Deltaproteobacteria bacterium]|nr:MAG: hypothetical protein DRI57_08830 [Deltaproteobacteria bacterium]
MSENNLTLAMIRKIIDRLFLSERLRISDYKEDFYSHLTSLLRFHLTVPDEQSHQEFQFNKNTYMGLEQFILENSDMVEETKAPDDIDWDLADDAKDILKDKIKSLSEEEKSDDLKPFIESSANIFENWLIYDLMHPGSVYNPWIPAINILQKGYVYFISDDKDRVSQYQKKIYHKTGRDTHSNLAIVTRGSKKRKFSVVLADNRHNLQISVYQYLKEYAPGSDHVISLGEIKDFLETDMSRQTIRTKITSPLKKAGLIGSNSKGFFYIATPKDLKQCYTAHLEKVRRLQGTLKIYEKQAKVLGIRNLGEGF